MEDVHISLPLPFHEHLLIFYVQVPVMNTFLLHTGGATLVKFPNLLCHHQKKGDYIGTYLMEFGMRSQCTKAHI